MADLCNLATQDNPCCMAEENVLLPTICLNDRLPPGEGEPHEPPMGFEDGSLTVTWNKRLVLNDQSPDDPRPFKYEAEDASPGSVAVVRVQTEQDDGHVLFTRYIIPASFGAQLLIWLQQLTVSSPADKPVFEDKKIQPQILVSGNSLIVMETDKPLTPFDTFKEHRPFGFHHAGYFRHFRIAAWAIVDFRGRLVTENNDPLGTPFSALGQDGYHIYVSFHDTERVRSLSGHSADGKPETVKAKR
jgi:hypothetical protein